MMRTITADLKEWGVPDRHIHYEAFGAATVKKVAPSQPATSSATFKVEFTRSGKLLEWDGSAESILDFAESNGIAIDSGCRAGNCGTCVTAVKEGEIEYVTEPGDKPESGSCLACITVPKGNLKLDA